MPNDTNLDPFDINLIASACRARADAHRNDGRLLKHPIVEDVANRFQHLADIFSQAAAVSVVAKDCTNGHNMTQPDGPGRFYACSRCGARSHIRACIDPEEGTITCVCGFDRAGAGR